MAIKRLKLSLLITDAGTQTRSSIDTDTVEDYSEQVKAGVKFPPLVVFYDKRKDEYYLVDGFHRETAFEWNGIKEYNCEVMEGDLKAAIKYALGANAKHGLRRSNEDKRYAVKIALKEFGNQTDRAIAQMCAVHHDMVSKLRPTVQLADSANSISQNANKTAKTACPPRRIGTDGKSYPAKKSSPPPPPPKSEKDETGLPIPPEILEAWKIAKQESTRALGLVSDLRVGLREAQGKKNPTFAEIDFTDDLAKLDTLYADLKRSTPYAVCFKCNGVNFKTCADCKRRGWISEHFYNVCVPDETKKITKR